MKQNFEIRYASHQDDVKHYDTAKIRKHFLVEDLMVIDEINMIYTMFDRLIVGGAVPGERALELKAPDEIRSEYFLERRELGFINVGGAGVIETEDAKYDLNHKEALYIGRGVKKVIFKSADPKNPAKFYFNSAPAHTSYPSKKITKKDAVVLELGSLEGSNHRFINRMIVKEVLPTCQLQMGMTELQPGSVWNTMPAHTHNRRMEAYFYFDFAPEQAVCHFMGEPTETRHIWLKCDQAVISPQWSIHSACATTAYTFIWGMAGENLDYNDMDGCPTPNLR